MGIHFTRHGLFNYNVKQPCNKAMKAVYCVIAKSRGNNLPIDCVLHLLDTIVQHVKL